MNKKNHTTINCPVCHIEFDVANYALRFAEKHNKKLHCSVKCGRITANKKTSKKILIKCKNCPNEFLVKPSQYKSGKSKTFCCEECRKEYGSSIICSTVLCAKCGKPIKITPSRQKCFYKIHCSKECARQNRPKRGISSKKIKCLICNVEFSVSTSRANRHHVQFCSNKCKGEFMAQQNEKSRKERGTTKNKLQCREYKAWRTAVYERDNYTCQHCGDNSGGNLEAHHIKSVAEFPEEIYNIDNGLTLCEECHKKTDNWGFKNASYKKNHGKYCEMRKRTNFKNKYKEG